MEPITPLSVYKDHYGPGCPGGTTGGRNHKYRPLSLGSIYRGSNALPGPSYREILSTMTIADKAGDHEIKIEGFSVFIDGIEIARAPSNKSRPVKERFLKAVVWGIKEDIGNISEKLEKGPIGVKGPEALPDIIEIPDPLPARAPRKIKEWIPAIVIPDPLPIEAPVEERIKKALKKSLPDIIEIPDPAPARAPVIMGRLFGPFLPGYISHLKITIEEIPAGCIVL